jgi:hypothetical protein
MSQPTREHCNVCRRDVFVCATCGKPSCIGGRTSCTGCEQARAADDAQDAEPIETETTGSTQ